MRYLKLFESLNYYEKISADEFYNKIFLPEEEIFGTPGEVIEISSAAGYFNYDFIEKFTEAEIKKVDNALENTKFEVSRYSNENKKIHNGVIQITHRELKPSKRDPYREVWTDVILFEIFKSSDEWFYVYQYGIDDAHYKCDQIDGLIKFVSDMMKPFNKGISESYDLGFEVHIPGRSQYLDTLDFGSPGDKRFTIRNSKKFDEKDIDKIKSLLSIYGVYKFSHKMSSNIGFWIPYKDITSTKKYISVESFNDEWFLLADHPLYYECDQIEGVINCLKTLLPKKD